MKHIALLHAAMATPWLIDQAAAQHYMPLYARVMAGHAALEPRALKVFQLFDDKGNPRQMEDTFQNGIASINLVGPMFKYGSWYWWGADEYAEMINYALNDRRVSGIILKIDSPGGEVGAINPLIKALENRKKPVVALADNAMSAAMWLASHTDHIMGHDAIGGSFGSIGVVVSFMDFEAYYEAFGIKVHTIYAKESDYKNREFEDACEGNYEAMQDNILSPIAKNFQAAIKSSRPKLAADEPGILAGKTFYTAQALKLGLIDSIGTQADAKKRLKVLADVVYPVMNNK